MKRGYARVSSIDQKLEVQKSKLINAGCEIIYEEKISGAVKNRPELLKLLNELSEGDTVVIFKLDRLARSARHFLEIVELLEVKNCNLKSLSEPWLDTTSSMGKMITTIVASFAEFERDLIKERTALGIAEAKRKGTKFGRPPKLSNEQKELALELKEQGKTWKAIASILRVDQSTLYRNLKTYCN